MGVSTSHIRGLGTASYGLTKGMAKQEDMEILFVVPKPWGDEDQSFLKIIGCNNTPIVWRDVSRNGKGETRKVHESRGVFLDA